MPDLSYPEQSSYAFRPGVTCLTTPAGAVLLNPPHSVKLARLDPGQRAALQTLNLGPATVSQLSPPAQRDAVTALLDQLLAGGWLSVTVGVNDTAFYSVEPFAPPTPVPDPPTGATVLSKFAVLHRDADGFVLEHPLSSCDLRIQDSRLLILLDGSATADPRLPAAVTAAFLADLHRYGFLVRAGDRDDGFDALSWSAPDLWFHRRSTLGARTVTWDDFGPTRWAAGRFPPPPARRPNYPGPPIVLPAPDLTSQRAHDPTLTTVLEDRVSTRSFTDDQPITVEQLAELLYRTARTRHTRAGGAGDELLSRPYPSAGGVYELELYPVVHNVAGLAPGMYHYDSFDHLLRPVAAGASPAVSRLVKPAAATLVGGAEPQVLLVLAARSGRILWTYQQIGYALILKDVGALMQTIYLVATAMGLGVCAQGFGDTTAFTAATGVSELQECSVGSMVIGAVGSAAPA